MDVPLNRRFALISHPDKRSQEKIRLINQIIVSHVIQIAEGNRVSLMLKCLKRDKVIDLDHLIMGLGYHMVQTNLRVQAKGDFIQRKMRSKVKVVLLIYKIQIHTNSIQIL
jgi:hypothetical protein